MRLTPRPRAPFLSHERTRHGTLVRYFRRLGRRVRIRAEFGTPEFEAEYEAAKASVALPAKGDYLPAGLAAWLIERYRDLLAWAPLSAATKRQRENIFVHVIETAGVQNCAKITTAAIIAGRDRRKNTPAQARNFLDAMRGVFRWAMEAGFVRSDPTAGIDTRRVRQATVSGLGQRMTLPPMRSGGRSGRVNGSGLTFCHTGLRRGDAVRLGRQHVRDGIATLKTEKSGRPLKLRFRSCLSWPRRWPLVLVEI